MDSRGSESSGEVGLSTLDLRTLSRMRVGPGFPMGVGLAAALDKSEEGDVRG